MNALRQFTVLADSHGSRLDKWLTEAVGTYSRARLQSLIAEGAVSLNGAPVIDPGRRLKTGDTIALVEPDAVSSTLVAQSMALDIVYEDSALIVINKPAGMVVHPAAGNPDGTLVNALLAHCGDSLRGIGGILRPGIVHRIDKDTSGLIVAAKTAEAHVALAQQFAEHTIARRYDALVWGVPKPPFGTINAPIGRSPHNRQKMAIVKRGGKDAETGYETIASFGSVAAHVQCRLKTGRTHQIRVHMSSRGHPLIGDPIYGGGRKLSKTADPALIAAVEAFDRQALHASTLGFVHPDSGKTLRFESTPPDDFVNLENALDAAL